MKLRRIKPTAKPFHRAHLPTGRPFRGPTPKNVFQTVDIGAGIGGSTNWNTFIGELLPHRSTSFVEQRHGETRRKRKQAQPRTSVAVDLSSVKQTNPRIIRKKMEIVPFLKEMIANGQKTRHFNWDMPRPKDFELKYGLYDMFRLIPKVLLPNGKIFVSSEYESLVEKVANIAREKGFRARKVPPLKVYTVTRGPNKGKKGIPKRATDWIAQMLQLLNSRGEHHEVFRLVITFTPKTARRFELEQKRKE